MFHEIVTLNQAPENYELADVLDRLGNPDAVTLTQIIKEAGKDKYDDGQRILQLVCRPEEQPLYPPQIGAVRLCVGPKR